MAETSPVGVVWKARYEGFGKEGKGSITTKSGVLNAQPYGFGTRFEGQPGHPVLIPAALFDAFLSAAEGKTARDVMAEHAAAVRYVDTADPQVTADVDSPEDLARLRQSEDDVD